MSGGNGPLFFHFLDKGRLVIMNATSLVLTCVTRLHAPIACHVDGDRPVGEVHDVNWQVFVRASIARATKPV